MSKSKTWTADSAKHWIDKSLESAKRNFSESHIPQLVSFRSLCSNWDWAQRSDVYTHQVHSYPAKLLPYIPISFLTSSLTSDEDIILDPFAGTGTVLLEALVHNFFPRNSIGVEINPLARLIAKVKTTALDISELTAFAKELEINIQKTKKPSIPEFHNRDFWFRRAAQIQLASIRQSIEFLQAPLPIKDFFWVCFSAIIRDMSRADPFIAPPVLLKASKFKGVRKKEIVEIIRKKNRAEAIILFKRKVNENIERIKKLTDKIGLEQKLKSEIIWDDIRSIRRGRYIALGRIRKTNSTSMRNSVDFIITSPPYIAAQKYIRTTKLELSWLGIADDDQIRSLDGDLIGTERIQIDKKKNLVEVENQTADSLLQKVFKKNSLRARIASHYYLDMRQALISMHKVLKPGKYCVLVVGNNTISGLPAKNHLILSEMAAENGMFSTELILRDNIRSHGMITKRHETSHVMRDEYVLLLKKG